MSWIKDYAEASYSLFAGNTIEGFQPLDFFHFYPLWYDIWEDRIVQVMDTLDADHKSYQELKHLLPVPSNMRALIQKGGPAYLGSTHKNPARTARYLNFVARMLSEACPADPFGKKSTPLHTPAEIEQIVSSTDWQDASPVKARTCGQLITAAGSLVHGLYNDVVTDFGWDTYGPYEQVPFEGEMYTMLIRHFPDLTPGLWDESFLPGVKDVRIYQLYQGVQWRIGCVGCHTIVESGSPIEGLKKFAITADGKLLDDAAAKALVAELGNKAEAIYKDIRKKDFEQLKLMVMNQECYQLKKLFEAAGMDWKPTAEMLERITGTPLMENVLPKGVMVSSLDQYYDIFRIRELAREVLGEAV